MKKIENNILKGAKLYPNKIAIQCNGSQVTYATLKEMVLSKCEELRKRGEGNGKAMVIITTQSIEFLVTYFALHLIDGVAVPLENSTPKEEIKAIEASLLKTNIPMGTADILFTTGTTGKSKGVMISHATILANGENLAIAQGFSPSVTFIICGPLNHIGSLSKIYPVLLTFGTLKILEGIKQIDLFYDAMDCDTGSAGGKFATFLVPSAIRMLLTFSRSKLQNYGSRIEFIETGAAPISQADMEELCRILPDTRLYNTYASTETGIIATYNFNPSAGGEETIAGCLGRPMKNSTLTIKEEGQIVCGGKTLMSGYLNDSQATNEILKDGFIYTHDCGEIDSAGRLHLKGRYDDVINVGGFKVSPVEVENVALSLPEIADCICVAAPHPITGLQLKLIVVLAAGATLDKKRVATFLRSKLPLYKVPTLYETQTSIKRTYNGKIDRKSYR